MEKTISVPNVTLSVGATVNIGNFQSVRVQLSLSLPVTTNYKQTITALKKEMDKHLKECLVHYKNLVTEVVDEINFGEV